MAKEPEYAPEGSAAGEEDPRLDALEERIEQARKAEEERLAREHAPLRDGRSVDVQVISTLVGYPLGGILVGLLLDNLFDSIPWFTIALMFTAFAGACLHVYRIVNERKA